MPRHPDVVEVVDFHARVDVVPVRRQLEWDRPALQRGLELGKRDGRYPRADAERDMERRQVRSIQEDAVTRGTVREQSVRQLLADDELPGRCGCLPQTDTGCAFVNRHFSLISDDSPNAERMK